MASCGVTVVEFLKTRPYVLDERFGNPRLSLTNENRIGYFVVSAGR